jgi:imidazolonepropionase-like amidohydrolase
MLQLRLCIFCLLCCATAALGADLVIDDVTVVSPQQSQPLANRHVLIRDGRIISVSSQPVTAGAGAQRIGARGKFLVPGLTDSHVHVSTPAGLPFPSEDPAIAELQKAYVRQQPRSYLYFGVTQLVDLSNFPEGIAAFAAQPQHPDLFRCGAAVVLDGYPTVFADPSVRYKLFPDFIYEPANAAQHPLPAGEDAAKHTPEAVVQKIAASGSRCVKIFIENGFGDSTEWPIMSRETLKQVRAETRKRNLLLIAHANALDMQRIAVDTDVDVIAHGLWLWNEATSKPGVPEVIAAQLRTVHAKHIGYQPTLRVIPGLADLFRADTLEDPNYAKVVPPSLLAWYATDAAQFFKRQVKGDSQDPDMKIMHDMLQISSQGMRALGYLQSLGHPLLLGSDTPSSPTYGNQPGYDTYREMRLMAQSGVPLKAIFEAGTINNARQFGLDKDYGTVEAGKIANLVLLNANPLETLRAWDQIDSIVLHGKVIRRNTLTADRLPEPR